MGCQATFPAPSSPVSSGFWGWQLVLVSSGYTAQTAASPLTSLSLPILFEKTMCPPQAYSEVAMR